MSDNLIPFEVPEPAVVAAPAARKRSKPTLREVECSDCTKTVSGTTFYPHVGEHVWFVPTMSIRTLLVAMQLQGFMGVAMDSLSPEELTKFGAAFTEVTRELSQLIIRWDWTDDADTAYPSRPTVELLQGLSIEELVWLVNAGLGAAQDVDTGEDSPG